MEKCESCGFHSPTVKEVVMATNFKSKLCNACCCLLSPTTGVTTNTKISNLNIGEFVRLFRTVIQEAQEATMYGLDRIASDETKDSLKKVAHGKD